MDFMDFPSWFSFWAFPYNPYNPCLINNISPYRHQHSAFHDGLTLLDGDGRDGAGEL